jgi:hypothetical protein
VRSHNRGIHIASLFVSVWIVTASGHARSEPLPDDPSERRALTGEPGPGSRLFRFGFAAGAGVTLNYPLGVGVAAAVQASPLCGLWCLGPYAGIQVGPFGRETGLGLGVQHPGLAMIYGYSRMTTFSAIRQQAPIEEEWDGLEIALVRKGVLLQVAVYQGLRARQRMAGIGFGYLLGWQQVR